VTKNCTYASTTGTGTIALVNQCGIIHYIHEAPPSGRVGPVVVDQSRLNRVPTDPREGALVIRVTKARGEWNPGIERYEGYAHLVRYGPAALKLHQIVQNTNTDSEYET
jgi:hypothetical protein